MSDYNNVSAVNRLKTNYSDSNFSIRTVDIEKAFNGKMNYYLDGRYIGTAAYEVKSVNTRGNVKEVSTLVTTANIENKTSSKMETTLIKNGNTITGPLFGMESKELKLPIMVGKKIKLGDTMISPVKVEMISTPAGKFKTIQVDVFRNGSKSGTFWMTDGFQIVKAKMDIFGRKIELEHVK